MKNGILALFIVATIIISACGHKAIQETYWSAGTSVAFDEEKKGNIKEAETELRIALGRAKRELNDEKIASSLYNLGAFYRRQNRISDAIHFLKQGLELEEKVSGLSSERTGQRLAELAAAYAMEGNLFEGRPYVDRLRPLKQYFSGNEAKFIERILEAYEIDTEKYKNDVAKFKSLAGAGDPEAQYLLASVYFDGPKAKDLLPTIIDLYEKSAKQGFADAQYYLGVMYDKGRGLKNDDVMARQWYRKAAENKHPVGQFNYAVFLMQGRGGPKDKNQAWEWVKKSSAQGYHSAERALRQHNKK